MKPEDQVAEYFAEELIPDDGFTEAVMARLPKRTAPIWTRGIVPVSAALGGAAMWATVDAGPWMAAPTGFGVWPVLAVVALLLWVPLTVAFDAE